MQKYDTEEHFLEILSASDIAFGCKYPLPQQNAGEDDLKERFCLVVSWHWARKSASQTTESPVT